HASPSVSGPHGVLLGAGGCVHWPVCGLHGGSWVHWLVSGWHTLGTWPWTHWPGSQHAVVQGLESVSGHGVLLGSGGCVHWPVCGLHGGSWVHWLVSGWQTVVLWVWTHWPCSQPAVVHRLPSVSPHGVLSGSGGCVHCPVCGLHGGSWVHW